MVARGEMRTACYNIKKTLRKIPLCKKIRESTASHRVILFNNATAGVTVNLNVSQISLKQGIIP